MRLLCLIRPAAILILVAAGTGLSAGPAPAAKDEKPDALYVRRCPPVAFIKRSSYGMSGTNGTMHSRGTGVGSAICAWDPTRPDVPPRTIFEDKQGFILDLSPSYDGKTLLFSYKRDVPKRQDPFHVWEVGVDGTGLRQVTEGRFHDFTPAYLPDGRIVFNSTRVQSFSLCQDFIAAALHVVDADGQNLHRIEFNTLCDTTPWVMDDGSILFGRWEYQDKNIFSVQGLWTINPDGTRLQLFYGNTLTIPNSIYGAKQVPGSDKVVAVMAAHHHPPLGGICLIDRRLGVENPDGMKVLTPEVPYRPTVGQNWRHTNWAPGDRLYPWSFTDPYPLAEDLFLVSYGGPLEGGPKRYRLYLLTDDGRKVPLYDDGKLSCFSAVPLAPRRRPHVVAGQPPAPAGEGLFYVADVYQGLLGSGVKRGEVKEIRILGQSPKKYNTEGPRYHDHYPIIGYGSYYVKLLYGTVPVDEQGSAYFKAPAGVELYFEAVDATGKEIRRMGSVTQITAGEYQGCIGCHEPRSMAPPRANLARLAREPDAITPPPWGAGPVSFVKQVQPVLDRYCVRCHEGRDPSAGLDLSGDRNRFFNMAYDTLCEKKLVDYYYINQGPTGNFPPLDSGARVSKLVQKIEANHMQVDMDHLSRRTIYSWIDSNCPYYDTWDMSRPHSQGGRDAWCLPGEGKPQRAEWIDKLHQAYAGPCAPCHGPNIRHTWINLSRPPYSRLLNAHLAKKAGGMGLDKPRSKQTPPMFADTNDPLYRRMLELIAEGKTLLEKHPRMDMPGGVAIPQIRDFGRTY